MINRMLEIHGNNIEEDINATEGVGNQPAKQKEEAPMGDEDGSRYPQEGIVRI